MKSQSCVLKNRNLEMGNWKVKERQKYMACTKYFNAGKYTEIFIYKYKLLVLVLVLSLPWHQFLTGLGNFEKLLESQQLLRLCVDRKHN